VTKYVDLIKKKTCTAEMTDEETEGETITGDIQSVLEPDEAFVVVKEETIESKLMKKHIITFCFNIISSNRPFFGEHFEN
jgi:hypothetical protein